MKIEKLLETKFLKAADLQYKEGSHYFVATRHDFDKITAVTGKPVPDAATCYVIFNTPGKEPRLLLQYEYRYPVGGFLLSPPAGLIDGSEGPLETAKREIFEETGIEVKDDDRLFVVNPLVFSTPGMTDESNALVCAVVNADESDLNNKHCESTESFDGFELLTKEEALELLKRGTDKRGHYYPLYTYAALSFFALDLWK